VIDLVKAEFTNSGADPGFQVRGAHVKKLRRVEGGAKSFGVFRVKNHDFTPKNHIFPMAEGGAFWGISCEKSQFYAKKSYFFPILGGGGRAGCAPPPLDPPLELVYFQLYIMATTGYIRSDDVRFVLNQHAELSFYHSVNSLKQQSTGLDKSLHPYVLS
jgi:hypothetical protein